MTPDPAGLPPDKTCKDCRHFIPKCSWFISTLTGDETACDWNPSKFRAIEPPRREEPRP